MAQPDLTHEGLAQLVERVREAAGALMQGDARRYFALVNEAPDFTLMPPTGGPTRRGPDTSPAGIEALEKFFAGGGAADFELEQSYARATLLSSWAWSGSTALSADCPSRTGRCA